MLPVLRYGYIVSLQPIVRVDLLLNTYDLLVGAVEPMRAVPAAIAVAAEAASSLLRLTALLHSSKSKFCVIFETDF